MIVSKNLLKKTNLERYGTEYAQRSEEVKENYKLKIRKNNNGVHPSHTPEAKEKRAVTNTKKYGFANPLQNEEIKNKVKKTNLEKYGVEAPMQNDEIKEKQKAALFNNYGVTSPLQSDAIREKFKQTSVSHHGVDHPFASKDIQEKIRATLIERYGTVSIGRLTWFKEKVRETSQERYGVDHPLQSELILKKRELTNIEKYGVPFPFQNPESKHKANLTFEKIVNKNGFSHRRVSKLNKNLAALIAYNFDITPTFEKPFSGGAADLAVADVLIDLNPTVTHNSALALPCLIKKCKLPCDLHRPKARSSHYSRALKAKEDNISFIQFYEWDSQENIERFLSGKIGSNFNKLSARKLTLKAITPTVANVFMKENHFQGAVKGQRQCYALTSGQDLICVATFGPARFKAKEEFEWYRYAVKKNAIVHGGAARLFRAFLGGNSPVSIISYVDFNHTTKQKIFLSSLDFEEFAPTGPSLIWHNIKTRKRVTELALVKLGADRLLGTSYGTLEASGLTNQEIMSLEGFLPVYTAGNRVFKWIK